jgi:hypothetical protein
MKEGWRMTRAKVFTAVAIASLVIAATAATRAQPAFEVASVKPSLPGANGVNGGCHG